MEQEWIQFGKYILYFVACLAFIYAIMKLLEKMILVLLRKINDKRTYNPEKLLKRLLKPKRNQHTFVHDRNTGEKYYFLSYWVWQENKFSVLTGLFPKGSIVKGTDSQVTGTGGYHTKNEKGKNRRYKREFRVYYV
ncbi:hypothetical protein [Listeria valentina]|uniref:hypothetical protein n=1 Tax=Listeria valentina TaxID=2705293 RepID=UPI00143161EE|nr:hypothetical protein [Listeria valentina]